MDMEDIYDKLLSNSQTYYVPDFEMILKGNSPSLVKELYRTVMEQGYICTGDYFKSLSDIDLDVLTSFGEAIADKENVYSKKEKEDAYRYITMIAFALCIGEGVPGTADDEDTLCNAFSAVITLTAVESLYRKNLIEAFHENMSIIMDDNKVIARAKPGASPDGYF